MYNILKRHIIHLNAMSEKNIKYMLMRINLKIFRIMIITLQKHIILSSVSCLNNKTNRSGRSNLLSIKKKKINNLYCIIDDNMI